MEKLAALVPRPRVHLTRFHGVLAPNYKHRKLIIPTPPSTTPTQEKADQSQDDKKNGSTKKKRITWAQAFPDYD
ncbi:MAG: transposase [Bdellovibrionaceae bacterium]|nr:transposase [Pseudobdellovibrionaceae bacterium]